MFIAMIIDKKALEILYKVYHENYSAMKTIPSLLHPIPITSSIHNEKVFWLGTCLGAENRWDNPQNWHNNKVPSKNSLVVIAPQFAKHHNYPVIDAFVPDIAQLEIKEGAQLTIELQGQLTVDGHQTESLGIINHGTIQNNGELNVKNTKSNCIYNYGIFVNDYSLAIDRTIEEGIFESDDSSFLNCGEIIELVLR